jgi:hypothetical protein
MTALEFGLIWISGFVSGLVAMSAIVFHIGNKALSASKKKIDEFAKKMPNGFSDDLQMAAIEERMLRIKEIAQVQMDLQSAADGPQKNAMDGKYKNGLMAQLKVLEEEKIAILTSIVNDGFDPSVNVLKEDGTTEVTKLSAFLSGYTSKPFEGGVPADASVRQVGKFVVHKGGKDDNGNPTTH